MHDHSHSHAHQPRHEAAPPVSVLLMSLWGRGAIAAGLIVCVWGLVLWAVN